MNITVTLPNGVKTRTASQRRFVWFSPTGRVMRRSDSLATLYKAWTGAGYLIDTTTGEVKYGGTQ